jgi:hypothetical protein
MTASAVALSVVTVGALASTAGAVKAPTPVKTTVKITSTGPTKFTGTVSASKKACEKRRKVTLYRQASARLYAGGYAGWDALGTVLTDAEGDWEADAAHGFSEFLEGTYRASVSATVVTFAGHRYKCSPVWGVPTPA